MGTVVISKHPTKDEIVVEPETAVVRTNEKVVFKISAENGFAPGTTVRVQFQKGYRVLPLVGVHRSTSRCGPFARRGDEARNLEEGRFDFQEAGELETGPVEDRPWNMLPHVWKYDVSWTGLPDLDPMIKIERGG